MKNLISKVNRKYKILRSIPRKIVQIQEALGRIESRQIKDCVNYQDSEFRVFSQWGEDGIIQWLINRVDIERKVFVEFGVENYTESNTRFLAIYNNWSGLVIDGSKENIDYIKSDPIYWACNIKAVESFITSENINEILKENGISGDIGILSVDIDGNDYWVWQAINAINPRIVICEYNSHFGKNSKVSTPYDPGFVRDTAHHSKVYYGASISALNHLAIKKGYSLVASNLAGNNIFFVRNDLLKDLEVISVDKAYVQANFREYHDTNGRLTYDNFDDRLKKISNLELIDIQTNFAIKISNLER